MDSSDEGESLASIRSKVKRPGEKTKVPVQASKGAAVITFSSDEDPVLDENKQYGGKRKLKEVENESDDDANFKLKISNSKDIPGSVSDDETSETDSSEGDEKWITGDNIYAVESIHDYRPHEFFIKWKGWSKADNTWEPPQHLFSCMDMVDEFYARRMSPRINPLYKDLPWEGLASELHNSITIVDDNEAGITKRDAGKIERILAKLHWRTEEKHVNDIVMIMLHELQLGQIEVKLGHFVELCTKSKHRGLRHVAEQLIGMWTHKISKQAERSQRVCCNEHMLRV
eukprot:m.81833 g.81833  ORF g.81833 m.81833 type:complete len:286 (-) comp12831_c0_seq5:349-1206(-)